MLVGNRAYLKRDLPSKELTQVFRKIPVVVIGNCMNRNYILHYSIRLMFKPVKNMCGPALTVQSRGGDNLSFHKALDMTQEGDVIVMITSFCDTDSVIDEDIATNATFRKLGGLAFDASTRDIKGVFKMELPVYATGTTSGGPRKSAPGEINVPIFCGGCFTYPGGIIIGDTDDVTVVLLGDAEAVLGAVQKYYVADMHSQEEAAAGSRDREWVGEDLEATDVEIIDGYCHR